MAAQVYKSPASERRSDLSRDSTRIEKVVEYGFLHQLSAELYRRGIEFAVARDDADVHGRDLLLEARDILRHTQCKAMVAGGARSEITVNSRLARRPSACIIWILYDPQTFLPISFLWFGGAPGEPMPPLGDRIARTTRRNIAGERSERADHRVLVRRRFEVVATIGELVDRLFGPVENDDDRLLAHLNEQAQNHETLRDISHRLPADLTFDQSGELAGMIDGYALGGFDTVELAATWLDRQTATARRAGRWPGDAAELWTALCLEHRHCRATEISEPDTLTTHLRNLLCRQLVEALRKRESGGA